MSPATSGRGALNGSIQGSLRELRMELAALSHQVGSGVDLKDVDLDCLDIVNRYGPLTATALAARASLHPATMTGVLDRLERGRWVVRERDTVDRRAVLISGVPEKGAEIALLFSGMSEAVGRICRDYTVPELAAIDSFLRRVGEAGRAATVDLSDASRAERAARPK